MQQQEQAAAATQKVRLSALVTGATGFLGKFLVKRLQELNADKTHGYEYEPIYFTGRKEALGKQLEANELKGAHFIAMDLGKKECIPQLEKLFENKNNNNNMINLIFHCAALCEAWGPYQIFYESNYLSTKHLLDVFAEYHNNNNNSNNNNRFIFISTPSVYTKCYENQFNITEDSTVIYDPQHQVNYYAQTKRMAELLVSDYYTRYGIPIVTLRPRGIFGAGDLTMTPKLLEKLKAGKIARIGSNWKNIINDVTHVSNVCDACVCAAHADGKVALGQFYNITNGDDAAINMYELLEQMNREILHQHEFKMERDTRQVNLYLFYTLTFVIETLYWILLKCNITYSEPPLTHYMSSLLTCSTTFDISKAKRELNYKPRVTLQQGLKESFAYFSKL